MVDIIIQCGVSDVASFAANPDNAPKWYVNIKGVEWKTNLTLEVGSQIAFIAHFLGKRLSYTYEIIEYLPDEKLIMRTAEGPFPMETSYHWKSLTANSTLMILRNRGNPKGFFLFLSPFLALAMKRANHNDFKKLKSILENKLRHSIKSEQKGFAKFYR